MRLKCFLKGHVFAKHWEAGWPSCQSCIKCVRCGDKK